MGSSVAAKQRDAVRPMNLLYVICDQLRADIVDPVRHNTIRAPHMQALARSGTAFTRAYTTQPVCTPARASLMTGLMPHQSGARQLNITLRPEARLLTHMLPDDGHFRGYIGRWHLGDEVFPQRGFDEWISMHDEYHRHYRPFRDRHQRSDYHHWLVRHGYKPDPATGYFPRFLLTRLPYEHTRASFVAERSIDFLHRRAASKRPFALIASFFEPHSPFRGPFDNLYDPQSFDLEPNFMRIKDDGTPLRYRLKQARYANRPESYWRRERAGYAGLVHGVDLALGRVLRALDELDLSRNTLVVLTSDHGEMLGEHGLAGKSVMYESSVRVPLVVRAPGVSPSVIDQPASQIDLLPTVLDLMGAAPTAEDDLPGQSLVPNMRGAKLNRPAFIEWNPDEPEAMEHQTPYRLPEVSFEDVQRVRRESTRTIVTPDLLKLSLSDLDRPQLFDLKDDPYELNNRILSPAYKEKVIELTGQIRKWQEQTEDTVRVFPERQVPNDGPDYWTREWKKE